MVGASAALAANVTDNGSLFIGRGGNLNLNGNASWLQSGSLTLQGNGGFNANLAVNGTSSFTYAGATPISFLGATDLLTVTSGTFTTGQGISFNDTVGTVTIAKGGTLALSANIPTFDTLVGGSNTFQLSGTGVINTSTFTTTINSPVVNVSGTTGALTKMGSGTLVLSGSNSFSGGASVNAGTLIVSGSLTAANTLTTVAIGATLGGTGVLSGSANILSGGTLSPSGQGTFPVGNLTVNSFNLNAGAHLSLVIKNTTAGGFGSVTTTNPATGMSLSGDLILTVSAGYTPTGSDALLLVINNGTTPGGTMGNFSGVTVNDANGSNTYSGVEGSMVVLNNQQFDLTYLAGSNGNSVELLAIPEPGPWAMVLGGFGMLIVGQRLRRRPLSPSAPQESQSPSLPLFIRTSRRSVRPWSVRLPFLAARRAVRMWTAHRPPRSHVKLGNAPVFEVALHWPLHRYMRRIDRIAHAVWP